MFVASRQCLVIKTAYCVHIVLTLRLPGVTVGFYVGYGFLHLGFHSQALTLQEKFEFHKSPKVIRCCLCCLGSPGKSGEAHTHLVVNLAQPFLIKFKLHSCPHSFHKFFSWQTKSRIHD